MISNRFHFFHFILVDESWIKMFMHALLFASHYFVKGKNRIESLYWKIILISD